MFIKSIKSELKYPEDTFGPSGGITGRTSGTTSSGGELTKDEIYDVLGDDDDAEVIELDDKKTSDKETKDTKKSTKDSKDTKEETDESDEQDETEEETDELDEIEKELEGPTEEQLELMTPVRRREILKKYPQLFKDFPYLERAYYREQQFTELLPTIDDAKQAVEKADILDKFEKDLADGNIENMLKAAKNSGPQAFNKIADNYLTVLSNVDEKAYHHVIGNTIKHTIMSMISEARASRNEALQSAAHILNQFVFGSSTFNPPTPLTSAVKPTVDDEVKKKEQQFNKQRLDSANTDVSNRINNAFKSTIEANIDPRKSMSDYVRKNASREALEALDVAIAKDSRFKILVDRLWSKAVEDDFSKASIDRIRSAFVAKGKTLLPSVIKKARNEALKGTGKRVVEDDTEEETTKESTRKRSPSEERPRSRTTSGKTIPKEMSTLEFLMSDD